MRRFAWGAAIALVVMSACSSGRKDAPPTTTSTVATTTTTTVAPTPTTTIAETTTTSSTTSTSSTSTSTTEAPAPTTTVERAPQELIDAVDRFYESYIPCVQSPSVCDPATFISPRGNLLSYTRDRLADAVARGEFTAQDTRGTHWVTQLGGMLNDTEGSALVCVYDALIILGPIGSDGRPTVVNDDAGTYTYSATAYNVDGEWLIGDSVLKNTELEVDRNLSSPVRQLVMRI